MKRPAWQHLGLAAGALLALALPALASNFVLFQLTMVGVYAIAILGLNLLTGLNGQFSLGHGAFFALGAYTAAVLMDRFAVPYAATLPAAAVLCFAAGCLIGLPALRLHGTYLALATFALAMAAPPLFKLSAFEPWLGGVQGISVAKPEPPAWLGTLLPFNTDQWLYLFVLAIAVALFVMMANLKASRTGRALMALRDHAIAAQAMGVPAALHKSLAFGASALVTGIAGALSTIVVQFVAPESTTVLFSIALLVGLVVGGVGSIGGPLAGAAFILFVPNLAEQVSKSLAGAVYGALLLAVIYLVPGGVAGALSRLQQGDKR